MMKKYSFALTGLLILCLLTLTGCHGAKKLDSFETPDEFDTSKTYEITFWAKNDTNASQTAIYEKAVADFEDIYPNITVNMRLYNDYTKIYNDVITNISTGTTPNVCITYPDHIATYLEGANTVVQLDNLLTDEKYGLGGSQVSFDSPTYEEMVPQFLEECRLNGGYYAVPYMRSTEALYINKTYVEKLGYEVPDIVTWDFIWEVSDKAAEKDSEGTYLLNGQKVMIPFIYKSTDNMMIQYLHQINAPYSDALGNILLFNDETKNFLYTISGHVKKGSFSTFKISSYPANFLNAGQCIFAIDSTAGSTWMGSKAPLIDIAKENLVEFETVVRPIPQADINNPSMISQGPSVCVFNKEDPQEVLASWLFTQFLLTNEIQTGYAKTEGYVPVTTKAQTDPDYMDYLSRGGEDNNTYYDIKIEATRLLINNIDNTFITPVFNGSASLRQASGELIESVTKSTRRKQTVDDTYIDGLYEETSSLYHLDSLSNNAGNKADLGPLPTASKALIIVLICVWIGIGLCYFLSFVKNDQKQHH